MWLLCALCRLKSVCCLFSAPVCKEIKLVTFILSFILLSPKDYISTTVDTWSRHLGNTPRPPPIRPFIYFYLFIATLNLTLGIPSWCLVCVCVSDHHPPHQLQPIPPPHPPREAWRLWSSRRCGLFSRFLSIASACSPCSSWRLCLHRSVPARTGKNSRPVGLLSLPPSLLPPSRSLFLSLAFHGMTARFRRTHLDEFNIREMSSFSWTLWVGYVSFLSISPLDSYKFNQAVNTPVTSSASPHLIKHYPVYLIYRVANFKKI